MARRLQTAKQVPDIDHALVERLRRATRVAVLTGAGVSAESGVPTFRDAQTGLWARFKAEDLATPGAFARDPHLVWQWYAWRRELAEGVAPNPGHLALAAMEARVPEFTLITQNVDGLHRRAGSRRVLELHGSLLRARCSQEGIPVQMPRGKTLPRCSRCGAYVRPDIVWFGEMLPEVELADAWAAAGRCEVFLSVGTSAVVEPAASLPYLALQAGATLVEINTEETPLTPAAAYHLCGPSGVVLPALVRATWPEDGGTS